MVKDATAVLCVWSHRMFAGQVEKVALGHTNLAVSKICFGTSALGDMPGTYGYGVDEMRAKDTVRAIFAGQTNFLDTSRNYGFGRSEQRIGDVIRERGGLPEGFVAGPGRQAPLLDRASVVVCAGGHGMVAKALVRGLPLVGIAVPMVAYMGSSAVLDTARFGLAHEPMPRERLQAGADLVTFSGDEDDIRRAGVR